MGVEAFNLRNRRSLNSVSQSKLRRFESDPPDVLDVFVSVDEAWVHHFTAENESSSPNSGSTPTPLQESKGGPILRKGDGSGFWESWRNFTGWLPWKGLNHKRQILCNSTTATTSCHHYKPQRKNCEGCFVPPGQCPCIQGSRFHGYNPPVRIGNHRPSTLFSRSNPLGFSLIPRLEKTLSGTTVFSGQWRLRGNLEVP